MFRLSDTYMFCVSLFYRFQTELLSSRSGVVFDCASIPYILFWSHYFRLQYNVRVLYAVGGVHIPGCWIGGRVIRQPRDIRQSISRILLHPTKGEP